MSQRKGSSATAAEFVRAFSHWRAVAAEMPVFITNHRRETHVVLDIRAYDNVVSKAAAAASDEGVAEVADWIDAALVLCDRQMRVSYANRVAGAICRKPAAAMIGHHVNEALPAMSGSLMEVHARRTIIGGEPSSADLPSPFVDGAWLRFQSFPIGQSNALMFRDITEEVQRHRLADVKATILEAMSVHGDVGYVRLSVRGTIERVDDPFCRMVELEEDPPSGCSPCRTGRPRGTSLIS